MELSGDGTTNFKHFIKNAKKRAKHYPFREDQRDGSAFLTALIIFNGLPTRSLRADQLRCTREAKCGVNPSQRG
jgi:hypothetical protein